MSEPGKEAEAAARRGHGLTPEQLTAAMGVSDKWPFAADLDGWVQSHNAIRADLTDLKAALAALSGGAVPRNAWRINTLKSFWTFFEHEVHHHHDHEEQLFFPFMATKVTLPTKMSADHKVLAPLA